MLATPVGFSGIGQMRARLGGQRSCKPGPVTACDAWPLTSLSSGPLLPLVSKACNEIGHVPRLDRVARGAGGTFTRPFAPPGAHFARKLRITFEQISELPQPPQLTEVPQGSIECID